MLLTEYDEEKELKKLANSYYHEGFEKGEASRNKEVCFTMLSNKISDEIIKSSLSLSVEELNSFRREWEALKG